MKTAIKTHSVSIASICAASFFALSGAVIGSKAQAAEPPQADTVIVGYGVLNLDTEQGAKVLYARLRRAARTVCSSFEGRELGRMTAWQSCFEKAVASAVVQINKSTVTALHNRAVSRSTKG